MCYLFVGPDGLYQHRRPRKDPQFVGEGDRSHEITSNLSYLFNGPRNAPFPKAKNGRIGEVGWESQNLLGQS